MIFLLRICCIGENYRSLGLEAGHMNVRRIVRGICPPPSTTSHHVTELLRDSVHWFPCVRFLMVSWLSHSFARQRELSASFLLLVRLYGTVCRRTNVHRHH